MSNLPKPPTVPCGSCPYRADVPSGIWVEEEYRKLPEYDGETWEQAPNLFMCHQRDGCICGGWLMTHDKEHLLALRLNQVDKSVWDYAPDVRVFSSGREACEHGMRDIDNPSEKAERMMDGVTIIRRIRGEVD